MKQIKAGLEIHQQLDTHKLFCNCPSILRNDKPEFEVKRKLHAVAGESGEVDIAAKYEAEKDKEFVYQGYDTTCLVELDEEPPREINSEALKTALHIALHLNCEILPVTQIMRKTVVDGSNTSGFQRTVLIGRNGFVETESGKVRVDTVMLEEDSARPSEKDEDSENENIRVYKLDRLGVPLVEIGTAPDIKTPEQAKEVALILGDILRSCKVRRGIGTIRQDVNVSIDGHPRVEIKGFQDVKMFVPTIENEVKRQEENLKNKKGEKEVRKANVDGTTTFLRPMPGSSRMYPETDLPLLRISREMIDDAKKTLPKLREEVRDELMKQGVSESIVKILTSQGLVEDFETMLDILDEPKFVAKVMIELPKEVASHLGKNVEDILTLDIIESILDLVAKNKIERNDVKHIMEEIVKGKSFEEAIKIEKVDLSNVESEVAKIIKEKPGFNANAYMGLVMAKFKGKISGKDAMDCINKILNK